MATRIRTDGALSQKASKASNIFACNLFQVLFQRGNSQNIFFSPMSISTALAMTSLGAKGGTFTQMREVLKLDTMEESLLHQSFADLSVLIYRADAPYVLKAANRLYGQKDYPLLPAFVDDTNKYYGASMELLDFVNDGEVSRRSINSWVEKQTENRIKDLLAEGSVDALTRLVLVNAIYFMGDWDSKFKPKSTVDDKFFISASESIKVPMMNQEEWFCIAYDEAVSCAILELPYVKREVSLFIVLPDEIDGLDVIQKALSSDKIEEWVTKARLRRPKVLVSIPKFTLEQDFVMNDVLKTMGMGDPFDKEKADFSGMTGSKDLFISSVVHKAFLEVNEEGSEAAAAIRFCLYGATRVIDLTKPHEFKANRPFLVFIRDDNSGAVLFIGQFCKPTPSKGN